MSNKYDDGESRLNEYEVVKKIGNGRFGEVFLVKHKKTQEFFCWKAISYRGLKEREKSQLVIEVNVMRELKHKNIVRYIDRFLNKANQKLYILMEFCDAGDLSRNIQKCYKMFGKIEEHAIVDITRQLLHALAYCHNLKDGPNGERVLHRDLKPQNIFLSTGIRHIGKITAQANNLTSRPIAKIGDFGLSKNIGIESMAHSCVGTPYYWSPELLLHETKSYDDKSDMWALGCIIYELCSGKTPFHKANNFAQLVSELKKGPELPIKGKSKELNMLIQSLLHISPKERPSALQCLGFQIIKQISPPVNRKESIADQNSRENTSRGDSSSYAASHVTVMDKRGSERERSARSISRQNINVTNKDIPPYTQEVPKSSYRVNGQYTLEGGQVKKEMMEREQMERNLKEKEIAQRKAMEMKLLEQKRMERSKMEKMERERIERMDRERMERIERNRKEMDRERTERERMERERMERERIERERIERERIERERKERERKERERIERERIERERMERERIERERKERERVERERIDRDRRERIDKERRDREKLERERLERERERERLERERGRERLDIERERERLERERERERIERERERERLERERARERERLERERRDKYYIPEAQNKSKLDTIANMRLRSKNEDNYRTSTALKEKYEQMNNLKNYPYNAKKEISIHNNKKLSMYADDEDENNENDDDRTSVRMSSRKRDKECYLRSHSTNTVSSKPIPKHSDTHSVTNKSYNPRETNYNNVPVNFPNINKYSNSSTDNSSYKGLIKGQRNTSAMPAAVSMLKHSKQILEEESADVSYKGLKCEKEFPEKKYLQNGSGCKSSRVSNMYFNDSSRRSSSVMTHMNSNVARNRSSTLMRPTKNYEKNGIEEYRNYKYLEEDREYLLEKKKMLLEKEKELYGRIHPTGKYDSPSIKKDRYENMPAMEKNSVQSSRRNSSMSTNVMELEKRTVYRVQNESLPKNEDEYYRVRNRNIYDAKKLGRNEQYDPETYTCR